MTADAGRRGGRWWGLAALGALGVAAAVAWWAWGRGDEAGGPPPPNPWTGPVPVRLVAAKREDLDLRLRAMGSVAPLNVVTVRPRVDGPLLRLHFAEGQPVRAGQLLAEIDPAVYRAQLDQALGQQARNLAELQSAERDLKRYQDLFEQDSIARQQLDTQEALVLQLRGTIQADRAQVARARLDLAFTRVEAPIGGRAGLRKVDAGNLVSVSDTAGLVTIAQTQPIAVLFSVPEHQVAEVRRAFGAGEPLVVEAWDRGEQRLLASGRLATFDNQIDAATGTLRLKAEFANTDDALFPNQFVHARLALSRLPGAITIPADAVQHSARGPYVYVVADKVAKVRALTLGPTEGERIVVESGLEEGEKVVLEGLDRLNDGREVEPVNGASAQGSAAAPRTGG